MYMRGALDDNCLSEQEKLEEALENYFKAKDLGRKDDWLFIRIASRRA